MAKYALVSLLCLIVSLVVHAQDREDETAEFNPKIKFDDFKVPVYKGKKAKLNRYSSHTARLFRTTLKHGYQTPEINFAGHYTLVAWGCGSPCMAGAIIDVKTGMVYDIPRSGGGYDSRQNSRMLIVNPPFKRNLSDSTFFYFKNRLYAIPKIYIFDETTKKFSRYGYK